MNEEYIFEYLHMEMVDKFCNDDADTENSSKDSKDTIVCIISDITSKVLDLFELDHAYIY